MAMKLALFLAAALLASAARAQAPKTAPAKRKKAPAAVKAKKKAPLSPYKSTALVESLDAHYRYDEDGNPIDVKKPAAAAKKKAASSDDADAL